ncbi:MAG: hypothetical protein AB8F34_06655 [Akkermansiaceae bacterium]
MKVPLEPIPTEQIVIVKQKPPKSELRAVEGTRPMASVLGNSPTAQKQRSDVGQLEKAYPWLLGASTCLSALLCWMYVSKPVILQEASSSKEKTAQNVSQAENKVLPNPVPNPVADKVTAADTSGASLVPSDSQLPSSAKHVSSSFNKGNPTQIGAPVMIDPRMLNQAQATSKDKGDGSGWEKTNLKVQHILSADAGTGENEKIVINVPVLYQTRSMRWTPDKIEKAQDVLARLMLYERSLSNLRKDGEDIVADWNAIIRDTVPASALRADSPSLPYNHGQSNGATELPGSSSVIQVEEK